MAQFVMIAGGWHGGWTLTPVARQLRARGHDVFTPSLTGLGERAHLAAARPNLDTHIEDVANVLLFEELKDVVLCGHSRDSGWSVHSIPTGHNVLVDAQEEFLSVALALRAVA